MDKRSDETDRQSGKELRPADRVTERDERPTYDPKSGLPLMEEPDRDLLRKGEPVPEKKKSDKGYVRAFANYTQIAFTIAAALLIAVLIGRFLDELLGTSPWLLLFFSIMGLGAAFKSAFNISRK